MDKYTGLNKGVHTNTLAPHKRSSPHHPKNRDLCSLAREWSARVCMATIMRSSTMIPLFMSHKVNLILILSCFFLLLFLSSKLLLCLFLCCSLLSMRFELVVKYEKREYSTNCSRQVNIIQCGLLNAYDAVTMHATDQTLTPRD